MEYFDKQTKSQGKSIKNVPVKKKHNIAKIGVITGLGALSLDAISSVAYGPETIAHSLQESHVSSKLTLPVTLAIIGLLVILVVSYRQVITVFPDGGGSYAVAKKFFGKREALLAASSLIVDYVLNVPVAISAGVDAAWSAFPILGKNEVLLAVAALLFITIVNLRGIVAGAQLFIVPTMLFLLAILVVGVVGIFHPDSMQVSSQHMSDSLRNIGILVLLKAFANGCSALTGIEAIANAVPEFKNPRVKNAGRAEFGLGAILAILLLIVAFYINKYDISPNNQQTVLSQIVTRTLGNGLAHYIIQIITVIMLVLAANTSFGGLPNLMNLLAEDDYLPHRLAARTKIGVYRDGVVVLAIAAMVILIVFKARVDALVPLYSIGVFVGFTIAQAGLVIHWWRERPFAWIAKFAINAIGAIATSVACVVVIGVKFWEGAWLVFLAMIVLICGMNYMAKKYEQQDEVLNDIEAITAPLPTVTKPTFIIVPIASVSMLARKALLAATSMGNTMIAVHVVAPYEDPDQFEVAWHSVFPDTELVLLQPDEDSSQSAALTEYVIQMETIYQVVVVVADVEPPRGWKALLPSLHADQLVDSLDKNTNAVVARVVVKGDQYGHFTKV